MRYRFEFRPYQRKFARSLSTNHGTWDVRSGIILRLSDDSRRVGWGEIAPLPWFGSETFEQALDFCRQLHAEIATETIFSIPASLPACQFGFESAWETLKDDPQQHSPPQIGRERYSSLLPTGEAALQAWQPLWQQGHCTFKWKIGVASIEYELKIFHQLIQALPASAKLRLDANGGLNWEKAQKWLQVCDLVGVEFLEQPLPVEHFDAMLDLSDRYTTQLALDESVATLEQLHICYQQGWRGIFVIKPAIVGSPAQLRHFCREQAIDAVFSSVFETEIGRQAALSLARELSGKNRALGFGVNHWFVDDDTWLENLWQKH